MSGFMDNYVDVATRLKWAFEKYPDLRIQETHREVIEMPDKSCFIRCVVTIWRTADDLIPVCRSQRASCIQVGHHFRSTRE
jgi:hypothetical protein